MCERVGTAGHVVATDLDTQLLEAIVSPNIEVRRHDIVNEDLEKDCYDLVHARYVLLHLKEWEVVLKKLADSLKPGGWLFIEDPDLDEMMSDAATEEIDRAIIDRHFDAVRQMMSNFGMDMKFGSNTLKAFKDNSLESLKSESSSQVVFGGSRVAELFRTSVEMKDRLVSAGLVTGEDIEEFTKRTSKPTFLFRSMRTVFTLGRKPA
jgi:SAM-dependent methyltransferase